MYQLNTNSHPYAGTVMTSCYYASTPTHGRWFQTNQPEHELDDQAGDPVSPVCITNEKGKAQQQQIWSTFVTVLWCSKTKITDRTEILVLVRVLWGMIFKIYWQFWHSFFKNALESSCNFNPIEIMWRNMVRSVCLKPVLMAMWRLHTLRRFTVPAYWHVGGVKRSKNLTNIFNIKDKGKPSTHLSILGIWPSGITGGGFRKSQVEAPLRPLPPWMGFFFLL